MGQVQCQGVNAARLVPAHGKDAARFSSKWYAVSAASSGHHNGESRSSGRQILEREVLSGDFDSIRTYFHCSAIQACNARNSPACLSTRPRTGRDPG